MAAKRTAIFLVCMAAWAFIWWLAGFDFDRRGVDIAYFFLGTAAPPPLRSQRKWRGRRRW